jgi:thioesterase domain-containing protein
MRPDGCLEHLGRIDFQSKVLGQRIDVAEVERALLALEGIREAAAATRETARGEARLVAYVVTDGASAPAPGAWRRALSQTLPAAMIPSAFVALDSLPVDANGKMDRRALPAPDPEAGRAPHVPPRDDLERGLARIWEEELGVHRVGVRDDFFDLGGNSLSAAGVAARIERTLGLSAAPEILFGSPTLDELARRLRRGAAWESDDDPLVPIRTDGAKRPILMLPARGGELLLASGLAGRLGPDQPCYGFRWTGSRARLGLPASVEEMAADGVACLRRIQPAGPYRLAGFCFGGVVALEMARRLRAAGDEVEWLALISVSPNDFPELVEPSALERYRRHRRADTLEERLAHHARRIRQRDAGAGAAYLARRGRTALRFARARTRKLAERVAETARVLAWTLSCRIRTLARRPIPARLRDPDRISARAFASYRARPDAGRVVLFLPGESRRIYSEDPARTFAGLSTKSVEVHEVACRGGQMLLEPHVTALARGLSALLSESGVPLPTNGLVAQPTL